MKKLLLLLSLSLVAFGCNEDKCKQEAQVQEVTLGRALNTPTITRTVSNGQDVIIFSEGYTEYEGDLRSAILRFNPGAEVIVLGDVQGYSFIMMLPGSSLRATGSIITENLFASESVIESDMNVYFDEVSDFDSYGGNATIIYCEESYIGETVDSTNLTIIEDCVIPVQFKSLSTGGVGYKNGDVNSISCDHVVPCPDNNDDNHYNANTGGNYHLYIDDNGTQTYYKYISVQ